MTADPSLERFIERLFGEPLVIANLLVSKGKNESSCINASSSEIVQSLITVGAHEILAELLTNRIDGGVAIEREDLANGRLLVQLAALSNCLILTQEALESKGQPNEREKMNAIMDSLVKIKGKQGLGNTVHGFAERQADLLCLRVETPSKMRWLNGTGGLQICLESCFRYRRANRAIRNQPQSMLTFKSKVRA